MLKKYLFIILLIYLRSVNAQELNCQVSIITDAKLEVTTTEQEALKQLEEVIFDFMNGTKWTKDKFTIEERINCSIQLQIKNIPTMGTFSGSIQVLMSRPSFNSSYNSLVFNFLDENVVFAYSRNTPALICSSSSVCASAKSGSSARRRLCSCNDSIRSLQSSGIPISARAETA